MNMRKLYKEVFFIYIFLSVSINGGYAFKIGETTVAYNTFLSLLLLLLSIPFLKKGKYNKKILFGGLIFYLCIGLGILWMNLSPYTGGVVKNLEDWDYIISGSRFISYTIQKSDKLFNFILGGVRFPIILAVASKICLKEDIKKWIEKIYKTIPFFVVFGFIEFIMKKILSINIYGIVSIFIGDVAEFSKLQGFTKEASQYAMTLFIYTIVIVIMSKFDVRKSIKNKYRIDTKLLFCVYILMVLNTSLTSYYFLILSIVILLLTVNAKKKIMIIFSGICVLSVILIIGLPDYFVQRFGMINQVLTTLLQGNEFHSYLTSEGARLSSIYYAILAFIARPLFGVGIGNTDAHSTFFAILANFGLIGVVSYFYIWWRFSYCKTSNSKKVFWILIASTLLSGGLGYFSEFYLPFMCLAYSISEMYRDSTISYKKSH